MGNNKNKRSAGGPRGAHHVYPSCVRAPAGVRASRLSFGKDLCGMVAVTLYKQTMVCWYGGASYRHELERVRCALRRDPVLPAHERYLHTLARISRNKEAAERPVRSLYTKGMALFTAMTPSPLAFGKLPAPAGAEASGRALSVTVSCPTCRAAPDPSASGAIITACFDMTSLAGRLTGEVLREKLQPEQRRIAVRSFLICRILFQNQVSRSCISRAREGTPGWRLCSRWVHSGRSACNSHV